MASSIKVAIEVDNKKYIAEIKAADDTTQKFATNATRNLDKISLVSNNLISRLGGLKAALAGLVSATAIQQANNFANAIKDIATTADVSIDTILGLGRAFELNGGSADGAQQAILKFADTIAQARNGNDSALKSFKEIGISIDDLNKNGIEELTKKSIAGIAGLSSAAAQIRTQTDLFGKSAKGVSFGGVQQTQSSQYISPETVSAIKSGADASENMKRQFAQLTEALLRVAQPLNDIAKNVNISVTAFESLIKAVLAAVTAFALFKGIGLINSLLNGLSAASLAAGGVLSWFALQFGIVINSLKYFILNMGRALGLLATAHGGLASVGFALGALVKGFLRFAGVVGIIYTVVEAIDFLGKLLFNFSPIDFLIEKFNGLLKVAKEFFGLKPSEAPGAGAGRGGNAETLKLQQEQGDKMKKAWDEQQQAIKEYKERVAKLGTEIRKIGDSYAYNNDQQLQGLALEARLVGKTEDEIELANGLADIYRKQDDTIKQLIETRKQWAMGTEDQRNNIGIIDAEIAKIKQLTKVQVEDYQSYLANVQGKKMIERARLADMENMIKAMEQQAKIQETLSGSRLSIISQGQDVKFAGSQIGKGDLQKQMAEIAETNRKAGLEASRAFAAAFEDGGDGLTPERAKQLADGLAAIEEGYKGISKGQLANLNLSRTWATGWDEAFANYRDAAQNSADQAKTYFTTFTTGVEDAIVKFVQTGKLSFKDLANSIIAEFVRIQAKQLALGLFDGKGGGLLGGLFGSLFGGGGGQAGAAVLGLPGYANGGNVSANQLSIVGERGPELFKPRSAGTVIPNGGFGGNTTVTYNINAVDASSFKSMVAQDPEFIYGVSERGRKNLPLRSRL